MLYDGTQEKLKLQSSSLDCLWEEDKQQELEKYSEESLHQSVTIW